MTDLSFVFEMTPALVAFRQIAGEASRHLNTLAVGVETIKTATPLRPDDLPVAWHLPTTLLEWQESRAFAIKMAMVAVVDGLDQYAKKIAALEGMVPATIIDTLKGKRAPGAKHRPTLPERLDKLAAAFPHSVKVEYLAVVHLLTAWRNKYVHKDYRFGLSKQARETLTNAAQYFRDEHAGADIVAMIAAFDADQAPDLSHIGTMVSSAHRLVTAFDEHLLHCIDPKIYPVSLAKFLVKQSEDEVKFVNYYWERGGDQSTGRVLALFGQYGTKPKTASSRSNAPTMMRPEIRSLIGFGRNKAREEFISTEDAAADSPRTTLIRAMLKATEPLTETDLEVIVRELEAKAETRQPKAKRGKAAQ